MQSTNGIQSKTNIKLFNKYFFIIAFINLGVSAANQMFTSALTLHIVGMGYNASISGTIISIGAIAATIYRFLGGKITNARGRKQLIVSGLFIYALMCFLLGALNSLILIYIVRVVQMIGFAMVTTAISIAIIDVVPKERLSEGIGYFGLTASISQALGPSIAVGLIGMQGGFFTLMTAVSVLCLVGFFVALFTLNYEKLGFASRRSEEQRPRVAEEDTSYRGIWKYIDKRALPAALCNLFTMFAGSLNAMFLTYYATTIGIANSGLFFTISVIFTVISRTFSGRLSDKFGTLSAVVPGISLSLVCFILLKLCPQYPALFYVAGICSGLGNGMTTPALNAAAVRSVEQARVGIASSTFQLPTDIAFMLGSVVWGALIDLIGFGYIHLIAAAITLVALVLAIVLLSKKSVHAHDHS